MPGWTPKTHVVLVLKIGGKERIRFFITGGYQQRRGLPLNVLCLSEVDPVWNTMTAICQSVLYKCYSCKLGHCDDVKTFLFVTSMHTDEHIDFFNITRTMK